MRQDHLAACRRAPRASPRQRADEFDDDTRAKLFLIALLRKAGLSVADVVQVIDPEIGDADAQKRVAIHKLRAEAARLDQRRSHIRMALLRFHALEADIPAALTLAAITAAGDLGGSSGNRWT